jgi:hypothetical protein
VVSREFSALFPLHQWVLIPYFFGELTWQAEESAFLLRHDVVAQGA